jgi:Aspartyl protease/PDZ domain
MPSRTRHFSLLIVLVALSNLAASQNQPTSNLNAQEILGKWRNAVRPRMGLGSQLAVLASDSNQDGIPGRVEEWITTSGEYRAATKRDYDEGELVVTRQFAKRRDWNGYVRDVQGKELSRLRAAIFEKSAITFGPPPLMPDVVVSQSDDKKLYLLHTTPAGSAPLTWYIDAVTWLPVKSVRPGDDTEITTTYDDWRPSGETTTPHRVMVSETDKPDYQWKQTSLRFEKRIAPGTFEAPIPGQPDAFLQPDAPPIPFNYESSHIIFKIQVNGREPTWFLLDTGADENVINTSQLADFGLKTYAKTVTTGGGGSADYDYAAGATFKLPGVEVRNQHVAVLDQTGLEYALGMHLGGILGYDFISRFVIEIDYQKKLLTLHDPKVWSYSGSGYVVPVTFDGGIPFADGMISVATKSDIPAYFVLDFGAAETMTLTSPFVKANDLLRLAQTNANVNRPAGLENQFFSQNNVRGHIDQLALGKLTAHSIPVNLSVNVKGAYASPNFSGTVGESIFRRYHAFLDYAHNRVILEPTAETELPFPERKTYGLTIIASGSDLHTYTVTAVRPGSQAEKDGFKKADVIAAMNGKRAAQFTLGELREQLTHEGETFQVGINRADQKLDVPVQIKLVSMDRS